MVTTIDEARCAIPNFDEIVRDLAATRGYAWSVAAASVLAVMQPEAIAVQEDHGHRYQTGQSLPPNRQQRRRQAKMGERG